MAVPNAFLLTMISINGNHLTQCFCGRCRAMKLAEIQSQGFGREDLFRRVFRDLDLTEEQRLNKLFATRKQRILYGKAYVDSCLFPHSRYDRWGCWAKKQPQFANLSQRKFEQLCTEVTEIKAVYNNWETICDNLTDPRMRNIDARKLSIHYLYRAIQWHNCISYNEELRNPGHHDPDNPEYPELEFRRIMDLIEASRIYDYIGNDAIIAAKIGKRIKAAMIQKCLSVQHNTEN